MFDKNGRVKGVLSSTPVYQQSSCIENCRLCTDVKCLCDTNDRCKIVKKLHQKIVVGIKQLSSTCFHL